MDHLYRFRVVLLMPDKSLIASPRRGRPPLPDAAEVVYFRCPPHLTKKLDLLARASGLTRSGYIREALLEVTGTRLPLITKTDRASS